MVFAVTDGALKPIQRPVYQAPRSVRLNDTVTQEYAAIYRAQSEVRTVVDFLARNVAQLSLQAFRRVSDTDRKRLGAADHPVAALLNSPNSYTTPYRMIRSLVSDTGIYDFSLWVKTRETVNGVDRDSLVRIPPRLVSIPEDANWLRPDKFTITGNRGKVDLPASSVVYFRGYNPEDERHGLSPLESLRRILSEEWAAGVHREQVLRNGARYSGYLKRPASNTEWSNKARERFRDSWRSQYQGATATEGGGTPILEEGMEFIPSGQSAVDLQYVEARKLTREEVASAYFIPPPMIGILDKATFSNITEQHKMLYQDTLGPILKEIVEEWSLQITSDFPGSEDVYVEFNMMEKLRGSFEEQASQLSSSVGAPFLSRAEARARLNLPTMEGTDDLVIPLNVLIGGQASPTDSTADDDLGTLSAWRIPSKTIEKAIRPAPVRIKARPPAAYVTKVSDLLGKFFTRQEAAVRSALGAKLAGAQGGKADAWWNEDRWNGELATVLYGASALVTTSVGRKQLETLGLDPDEYDSDRTLEYLAVVAKNAASSINAVTKTALDAALDADEPLDQVEHVFDVAKSSRSAQAAGTLVTNLAGFASVEAVDQVRGTQAATKSWLVTSANPRPSHASMDGETVPIESNFSNGAKWPGDQTSLDVDEVAGCSCELEISFG